MPDEMRIMNMQAVEALRNAADEVEEELDKVSIPDPETAYQKIEDSVVGTYKKIEQGAVNAYKAVEDFCVEKLFAKPGESVEDAKQRLSRKTEE